MGYAAESLRHGVSLSESRCSLPVSLMPLTRLTKRSSSRAVAVRAGEATMTPEPTERIPTEQPHSADGRDDEIDEMGSGGWEEKRERAG